MSSIKVLGIDLGKSSFHIIARGHDDSTVIRKKFTRKKLLELIVTLQTCTIAFEACGGALHHPPFLH